MKGDIDFDNGKGIKNISYLSSSRNINIYGPTVFNSSATFERPVQINRQLTVVQGLEARTLKASLLVRRNYRCDEAELGQIAREGGGEGDPLTPTGTLLVCKKIGEKYKWRPVFGAQEEKKSIVGCFDKNDFCRLTPEQACNDHPDADRTVCRASLSGTRVVKEDSTDGSGGVMWAWEKEIGEKTFCALGFHAQTSPQHIDLGRLSRSGLTSETRSFLGELDNLGVGGYPKVQGGPDHTFCRVWPKEVRVNNTSETRWFIKAGSSYKTPVACHAVCLDEN
jgi:hypothetical protein